MRLAYLITLHHKERQFAWLFNAIYDPSDSFAIHVDSRTPAATFARMQALTAGKPNVHVLPRRPVTWGGWSLVQVTLDGIRLLLDADRSWGYFVNLSGQDFPIRSLDAIRAALAAAPDRNYIEANEIVGFPPWFRLHLRRRLLLRHVERKGRLFATPIPNFGFGGLRVKWMGSNWCTLSREFCAWLATDRMTEVCSGTLRRTMTPDEFFMQTLALNGPFAPTVAFDNRREILWAHPWPHPETLTMAHLDRLLGSEAHFARKFDDSVDADILRALARRVGTRPLAEVG